MSASMIRRGLELLSNDIKDAGTQKKTQSKMTPGKGKVMDRVGTNRQGVSKQVRRLQGRLATGKAKATVKDKRIKSAVEEFKRKQKKSHLSNNLSYFLGTGYKTTESDTKKIFHQHSGRQSRHRPDPHVTKAPEPESAFTEEEFQKFQKEYFGRTVEDSN